MSDENILSFTEAHDAKHGPDPDHVYRDADGSKWFEFCCEFEDGDKTYGFTIWAKDIDDAERRMGLLRASAVVKGKLYSTIPG